MTTTTPPPRTGLRAWARANAAASAEPITPLTPRQLQVLQCLAAGLTYDEIGRDLYVTLPTVKVHVGLILDRLRARNAVHAVAIGYQAGLLTVDDTPTRPRHTDGAA